MLRKLFHEEAFCFLLDEELVTFSVEVFKALLVRRRNFNIYFPQPLIIKTSEDFSRRNYFTIKS